MSEESVDFLDFKLNKQLWSAVADAGYETPTEIQQKAIPLILAGNDVVGVAQTGTGKTAAYLLPLLMKIKYAKGDDPRALIVVPTRELALQVLESIKMLAKSRDEDSKRHPCCRSRYRCRYTRQIDGYVSARISGAKILTGFCNG